MSEYRDKRTGEVLREMASRFFLEESTGHALITVTSVKVSGDLKHSIIYFTVFPAQSEKSALDFAKRKRALFRSYLKDHSGLSRLPFIDFEIDLGEKNRQLIDNISNQS